MKKILLAVALLMVNAVNSNGQTQPDPLRTDWPNLARYREANAQLAPPARNENRVVFLGNSITEGWTQYFPTQFAGKPYINRGISGQTTPQMVLRFRQDVIALKPKVVVILAGINDIAGNTDESTTRMPFVCASSVIEARLSSIISSVDGPVLPAMSLMPARITTTLGFSAITS